MVFGVLDDDQPHSQLRWNNYYSLPQGLHVPYTDPANPEECFFLSACGLRETINGNDKKTESPVILMRPASWKETKDFDLGRKQRTQDYALWKEEQANKLVNAVDMKWNGLLDGFRVINTASPLTFRDELRYVKGSAYGVQHRTDQFAIGARTRLPGLWLSGQSTLLSGILGASLSALVTVGGIVGLESLWDKIRNC
jgi:all-trans-retinol 13,14-reductase